MGDTTSSERRSAETTGEGTHFRGRRVVRHYEQHSLAPPDRVFPLICPVREAEWLEDWASEVVFSASGVAEDGAVFTTHPAGEPETVWVVSRHEAALGQVAFVRVTPGAYVTLIEVQLGDNADGTTAARITYTFTALSERGSALMDSRHSEDGFHRMVTWWERSMNHFLTTGQQLRQGHPGS